MPQQLLADPYPANNPVIEPYGQDYGRYTGLGGAVSLDQYQLRPQVNDRFNFSFQREVWAKTVVEANYFLNLGSRVPYDINLNMADPAFRYEQKAVLNTQVTNPFRNYLTPEKFPGQSRNTATVTLGSLLVPYPQYGTSRKPTPTASTSTRRRSSCARSVRSTTASACWWPMRGTTSACSSGSTTSPTTRSCRPTARTAGSGGRPIRRCIV